MKIPESFCRLRLLHGGLGAALALLALPLAAAPDVAEIPEGTVVLVSTPKDEPPKVTSEGAVEPVISRDGRYVAFQSTRRDLVSYDVNGWPDVFVKDLVTGEVEAVSSTSAEFTTANEQSFRPAMSSDGRYIAFNSKASNLPGGNGKCQTFLLDRGDLRLPKIFRQRRLVLASAVEKSESAGNGQCGNGAPSVSDDGRFVAFSSTSTNLERLPFVTPQPSNTKQIFVRDVKKMTVQRLTEPDPDPENPNRYMLPDADSREVKISADGSVVVFSSQATNLDGSDSDSCLDLHVALLDGPLQIYGIDIDKCEFVHEGVFDLSRDGGWVAFQSERAFDPEDDDAETDVYVTDIGGGGFRLVSTVQAGNALNPSISADGRFIAYRGADNIYIKERDRTEPRPVVFQMDGSPPESDPVSPSISATGRDLAFVSADRELVPQPIGGLAQVFALSDLIQLVDPHPLIATRSPDVRPPDFESILANELTLAGSQLRGVLGVAADGVTQTVFRFFPKDPDVAQVTFRIEDENGSTEHVGALRPRTADESAEATQIQVVTEQVGNRRAAFAVWRAPDRFSRRQDRPAQPVDCDATSRVDECVAERPMRLEISFNTQDGPKMLSRQFKIVRPPVTLIHGLNSNAETWTWDLALGPVGRERYGIRAFDYRETNFDAFDRNLDKPAKAAKEVVEGLRARLIAATQADVVGHSMGGVLTRLAIAKKVEDNLRPENFRKGDFNRLITVGTPHFGSGLGCAVKRWMLENPLLVRYIDWIRPDEICLGCGAIEDLARDSEAIGNAGAATVPAHAMVGLGGPEILALGKEAFEIGLGKFLFPALVPLGHTALFLAETWENFFLPDTEHDLVVGRTSQVGGLARGVSTTEFDFESLEDLRADHLSETKENRFGEAAITLLETPPGYASFADGFPAPPAGSCPPTAARAATGGETIVGGLYFTSPAAGLVVNPGASLQVGVAATDGRPIDRALLFWEHESAFLDTPPFRVTWTVPPEAIGTSPIKAFAFDTEGNLLVADDRVVETEVPEDLVELRLEPDPMVLDSASPTGRFRVLGIFEDGVTRNITFGFGVSLRISDWSIIGLAGPFEVIARRVGTATVEARLGDLTATALVEVRDFGPFLQPPEPGVAGIPNTVSISGLEPETEFELYRGPRRGTTPITACERPLDLDSAEWIAGGVADRAGGAVATFTLPPSDAQTEVLFQAVNLPTVTCSGCSPAPPDCRMSAVLSQFVGSTGGAPQIFVQPDPEVRVRLYGSARMQVVAFGDGTLEYQWQRVGASPQDLADGPGVEGATTDTLVLSGVDAADEGQYRCVVRNEFGEVVSTSSRVRIFVTSGLVRDTFAAGTPGEPVTGRLTEVGRAVWISELDRMGLSAAGGLTPRIAPTNAYGWVPFDPEEHGLVAEVSADLKVDGAKWGVIGLAREPMGVGADGNGQVWAQLYPSGTFRVWSSASTYMLVVGTAPNFDPTGFNRMALRYDPLTRRASVAINGEEVMAETELPIVPEIRYAGVGLGNGVPDVSEVDHFEVSLEPAALRDTFAGGAPGEPVTGRLTEVGQAIWSSPVDRMGLSAAGGLTPRAASINSFGWVPFDPEDYGLVSEVSADVRVEGAQWSGVGFGRAITGFGGANGQVWVQLMPLGNYRVLASGTEHVIASGASPGFDPVGFNRVELRYDPLTRRASAAINGVEVLAETEVPIVPEIQYAGVGFGSGTQDVSAFDHFEVRLEPAALRDTFAGGTAGEPVTGRLTEVGEATWSSPVDRMGLSVAGGLSPRIAATNAFAWAPFDPEVDGLVAEVSADLKVDGSAWGMAGFARASSGAGAGNGQLWARLWPSGTYRIFASGTDYLLAIGTAPGFDPTGFNRVAVRYDPLTRLGSVAINGVEVMAASELPIVPEIHYAGVGFGSGTQDVSVVDHFEVRSGR